MLGIITSISVHVKRINTIQSVFIASLVTSVVYQLIGIVVLGYVDPFAVFALIIGAGFACVISMIVKIVMSLVMKKSPDNGEK